MLPNSCSNMKSYEIRIQPWGGFADYPRADSLFGHFCWFLAEKGILDDYLKDYGENPFLVFSSPFPVVPASGGGWDYYFPMPTLPILSYLPMKEKSGEEAIRMRKEMKKKKWVQMNHTNADKMISGKEVFSDAELGKKIMEGRSLHDGTSFFIHKERSHNSINRLTGTTSEGDFAPYGVEEVWFIDKTELVIFAVGDERINPELLREGLTLMGSYGHGRDASTGKGRFVVKEIQEVDLDSLSHPQPDALYFLSPILPQEDPVIFRNGDDFSWKDHFYSVPFTRYGRHGSYLANSGNPFKNPVLLADTGSVLDISGINPDPNILREKMIWGSSIGGLSVSMPQTIMQGYSMGIPIKVAFS